MGARNHARWCFDLGVQLEMHLVHVSSVTSDKTPAYAPAKQEPTHMPWALVNLHCQ